jgi:nucleoid-associated protein YgaU
MDSVSGRLVAAAGLLMVIWGGVYWLYDPANNKAVILAEPLIETQPKIGIRPDPEPAARPVIEPIPVEPPDASPQVPSRPQPMPRPRIIEPVFESYTVKPGDTFEKIARARYGSSAMARAVKAANPLKDPRRLKAGDVIRLPVDPENIQGRPAPDAPAPSAGGVSEYVVSPGDSLSKISAAVYGTSRHWQIIFEANRGQLETPERLRAGMRLRIPPKPAD